MIVDKAKMYTNSVFGLNSPANRVAEFLIGNNSAKAIVVFLQTYVSIFVYLNSKNMRRLTSNRKQ